MIDVLNLMDRIQGQMEYKEFNRSLGVPSAGPPPVAAPKETAPATPVVTALVTPPNGASLLARYAEVRPPPIGAEAARTAPLAKIFEILAAGGALARS